MKSVIFSLVFISSTAMAADNSDVGIQLRCDPDVESRAFFAKDQFSADKAIHLGKVFLVKDDEGSVVGYKRRFTALEKENAYVWIGEARTDITGCKVEYVVETTEQLEK